MIGMEFRTAFLLSIFLAGACIAADPTAWSSASWGMTDGQIKSAFAPGEVIDLPATDANIYKDGIASVGIPSITIEGTQFKVGFLTDEGKALRQVILQPLSDRDASETVFRIIEQALTVKYGAPFSTPENDDSWKVLRSQWKSNTSVIRLQYVDFFSLGSRILSLSYSPITSNGRL